MCGHRTKLVHRQWSTVAAAVFAMGGVECCYFLGDTSSIKREAAIIWLCLAVGMLVISAILGARPFFTPSFCRSPSRWWYLIAAFLPILLIYLGVNGTTWTQLAAEGVVQNVIGLDLLKHDHNLGIYTAAYNASYVARQYVLASLPTFAFGPSFAALRIGNSLCF